MHIKINRELICILSMSLAFLLLFAADFSIFHIQKILVSSIADDNPEFELEGYKVSAIVYTSFAVVVWVGPYVTYRIGPKPTMLLASIGYLMFIVVDLFESVWLIYAAAVVEGTAAGILWPAQGQYLIENSSPKTTARNFAIFILLFNSASIFGSTFLYIEFHGKKYLNESTRKSTLYSLGAISACSTLAFLCLPKTKGIKEKINEGVIKTLKTSGNLLISGNLLWLSILFIYAGIQQAFWNGIYSSCIGFTLGFGDSAKELVALSGIVMGAGALLGSVIPIVLAGPIRRHRFSRRIIVSTGVFAQLIAYLIAFVNLPDSSVFRNTEDRSLIEPNATLALLGSVLIAIGDSCLTTQEYAFIGDHFRHASAEACALYKFVKGVTVSACFYVCGHVGLHTQLPVMAVAALVGVAAFWVADRGNVSHDDDTMPVAELNMTST